MKRPDLLLLVAIWEFITAFFCLIGMLAVIFFIPAFSYRVGLGRITNIGAIFVIGTVCMILLLYTVIALTAGIGLLMKKEWGRVLAIVHAAVSLFLFPFGTVLGVLTLIYVTRTEVRDYFLDTTPA
ncbi:MAG: hypothetical protein ABIB93_07115 [Chloroflexota bacterium]